MGDTPKGKRIAIIAADQVEEAELVEPRRAFEDPGADLSRLRTAGPGKEHRDVAA